MPSTLERSPGRQNLHLTFFCHNRLSLPFSHRPTRKQTRDAQLGRVRASGPKMSQDRTGRRKAKSGRADEPFDLESVFARQDGCTVRHATRGRDRAGQQAKTGCGNGEPRRRILAITGDHRRLPGVCFAERPLDGFRSPRGLVQWKAEHGRACRRKEPA